MYYTRGFEAETLELLKTQHITYYCNSSVQEKDIGFIVYQHDTGIEVGFSETQVDDFISEVNKIIYDNRSDSQKEWDIGCDKYHNERD